MKLDSSASQKNFTIWFHLQVFQAYLVNYEIAWEAGWVQHWFSFYISLVISGFVLYFFPRALMFTGETKRLPVYIIS